MASTPDVLFYIPATSSLLERRPRTLKQGETFSLFDHYGDIVPYEGSPEGFYHRDTRFLSGCELLINDRRPLLLSSTVQDNCGLLSVDLTNPDFLEDGSPALERDTIHIVRTKFIWQACLFERISLHNFDGQPHDISLAMRFESDFADLFEVRGQKRAKRGPINTETVGDSGLALHYHGLANNHWRTLINFEPIPDQLDHDHAVFKRSLAADQRASLFVTISCDRDRKNECSQDRRFFVCMRQARRELRRSTSNSATIVTSNETFNEVLCRSMADLAMLTTETAQGLYPYAGIPWFSTAFGRDGLITAMELLWIDPSIAKGVLKFLAANQATIHDTLADAAPGKILHETRQGEMAELGEVPFAKYYGSVDSTPLFVMLAGQYLQRTGDLDTIKELWSSLRPALDWIDNYGDLDGDGFVEYQNTGEHGLRNQGWKDSHDSVFHADGQLADGPIAVCEVQGYVYAAKCAAADMARALGHPRMGQRWQQQADLLAERFNDAFWCNEMETYHLALDGAKRPCQIRSSNAGQVLFSGIAPPLRAEAVADQLLNRDFFSGWGIRTVARTEARFNPMSYHNGSIWPHDNALIALGFARYGLIDPILKLFSGLHSAASHMDLRRLPELFCGFQRLPGRGPTFYPVACSPQAWASATPFALLEACLGVQFNASGEEVRFHHPRLPEFLDEVVIRGIRIGNSTFDVMLTRHSGTDVSVKVLARKGDGRITVDL